MTVCDETPSYWDRAVLTTRLRQAGLRIDDAYVRRLLDRAIESGSPVVLWRGRQLQVSVRVGFSDGYHLVLAVTAPCEFGEAWDLADLPRVTDRRPVRAMQKQAAKLEVAFRP